MHQNLKIGFIGDTSSMNAISWISALEQCGTEVHSWTMANHKIRKRINFWDILGEIVALKKWIAKVNPDILIAYRTTSYGFFAAISGFSPYVVAAQGESDAWPNNSFLRPVKLLLGRIAIKRAALIHAWSSNMVGGLMEMHANPAKLLVKPRGILLRNFPYNPSPIEMPVLKAVVTRSLYKEYQIDGIIQAIAAINLDSSNQFKIALSIAGSGPEMGTLQNLIYTLKQESLIHLVGKVDNDKLKNLFSDAHLYISIPETEGASASLFEAFASGLFPLVSDLAGNRIWVENGVNGYLIDKKNISDLSSKIIQLRKNPALYQSALEKNRITAEHDLSIEKNMLFFINAYRQIVETTRDVRN